MRYTTRAQPQGNPPHLGMSSTALVDPPRRSRRQCADTTTPVDFPPAQRTSATRTRSAVLAIVLAPLSASCRGTPAEAQTIEEFLGWHEYDETAAELADIDQVVALKEAVPGTERVRRIRALCGDNLQLLSGDDDMDGFYFACMRKV